ncbi:DegT/DnrJ/EryC1/StrS family aminotransferase [Desulfobotulus mexicanus]|uniref:DegT/DnrJ/EryC1/StrS family aminotransferase n=1 Tax=Desulfobotulus mexicanus TaxID=2586642 RepID=A0A5Q4VH89_9BACT|nr:DegT/DnrJ/EryC1/StrS family aminotransferase [Desulfobotulus mexicanus]TYT76303.1 DegT/DnrJ/EryC1/StrS family aminotransferase [Desulfobotulus mexicanus]
MTLAIHGGNPVRTRPFPRHRTIGSEEKEAVCRVLDSGVLSKYLGCWHEDFMGGHEVRALEEEWAAYFGARHAIAVNSCTSGLFCAVGAIGTEPGDEIIVPPYTMSATAVAPLIYNAVPVFADIEADCFCLDPKEVEKKITKRTRAIMVVDLFGQPSDAEGIHALARKNGLHVIEDTAQAPGALYQGKPAGTLGHIGVFSLNYHKHIHCGEGGVVVTDDDTLAERIRLIRNHGESVVEGMGTANLVNMVGFNFRMTEMEAAVARCQLHKLEGLLEKRLENCRYMTEGLSQIPAITAPVIRENCRHAFYVHACKFDETLAGVSRNTFMDAVKAELPCTEGRESEGVKIGCGYVKPLYLLPLFQQKIAHGSGHFPFTSPWNPSVPDYGKGSCPVCEDLHEKTLFTHELMLPSMEKADMDDVLRAFTKVWEARDQLKGNIK